MLDTLRQLIRRFRYLLRHRALDDDLAEELEFHRAMAQQELQEAGIGVDEAAARGQRALGNDLLMRNRSRDVWVWPWLQDVSQDLRFAVRLLAKDRRFTVAAIVALALGIGVTNTIFTLVNTAMLRDVPFDEPGRLMSLGTRTANGRDGGVSYLDYRDWVTSTTAFSDLFANGGAPVNLSEDDRAPDRLRGTYLSANAFHALRVTPIIGRDFLASDDRPGAPAVALISYGVWQARYGGDRTVVGRAVRINDVPSTIIGVMPQGFHFPLFQDVWQPLAIMPGIDGGKRDARILSVFGRLADGVDLPRAQAEIATIAAQLAREHPDTNQGIGAAVGPMKNRFPQMTAILMTLMGAVTFVLLIACVNVANLLLARSIHRAREIAIRASLGATRWRIVRQVLIECVTLATCAGALGLLLSVFGVRLLGVAFDVIEVAGPGQSNTPYWVDLSMNAPVFLFVAALCVTTALVFGMAPALTISKTDVHDTLKDGGRGGLGGQRTRRWTSAFVAAELALTLILLAGAGLLWRSFLQTYRADVLIDAPDLVTMRLGLPPQKYPSPELQRRFLSQLEDRLTARTDLFRAAIGSYVPFAPGFAPARQIEIEGQEPTAPDAQPSVRYAFVGPRYFDTLGMTMARGRTLTADDERPGQESAIVDQRFAAQFFSGDDPIGRRIRVSSTAPPHISPWLTIVGIAPTPTTLQTKPSVEPGSPAMVYVPLGLEPAVRLVALVARRSVVSETRSRYRAIGDDPQLAGIVSAIREDVRALDPDLPVFAIETMDASLVRSRFGNRLIGTWFAILAGIALVLASVGLFALTAHMVASRTQEIGLRMALGAQASEVVWLFLHRAIVQVIAGLILGVAGALAIGQLLQTWMPGTDPRDPLTLTIVSTVLVVVSLTACLLPARRAAKLDPVIALREP